MFKQPEKCEEKKGLKKNVERAIMIDWADDVWRFLVLKKVHFFGETLQIADAFWLGN